MLTGAERVAFVSLERAGGRGGAAPRAESAEVELVLKIKDCAVMDHSDGASVTDAVGAGGAAAQDATVGGGRAGKGARMADDDSDRGILREDSETRGSMEKDGMEGVGCEATGPS